MNDDEEPRLTGAAFDLAAATVARLAEGGERTITAHEIATALHEVRDRMQNITSFDEELAHRHLTRMLRQVGITPDPTY